MKSGEIKLNINITKQGKAVADFLVKRTSVLLFLMLVIVCVFNGYYWYKYVYKPSWSEDRKQAYIKTKEQGTMFNREKFSKIVDESHKRKEAYNSVSDNVQDIFQLKNAP